MKSLEKVLLKKWKTSYKWDSENYPIVVYRHNGNWKVYVLHEFNDVELWEDGWNVLKTVYALDSKAVVLWCEEKLDKDNDFKSYIPLHKQADIFTKAYVKGKTLNGDATLKNMLISNEYGFYTTHPFADPEVMEQIGAITFEEYINEYLI